MSKEAMYRQDAERLFLEGVAITEIAKRIDVHENTLYRWKDAYKWEEKKKKKDAQPAERAEKLDSIINKYMEQMESADINAAPGMADSIYKLMKIQGNIRALQDVAGQTIMVLDDFLRYIREKEQDENFVGKLSEHTQNYFKELKSKEY